MPSVWVEDSGTTVSAGKNSSHEVVWMTTGYSSNVTRRAAIVSHASYSSSVSTVDGYTLDNLDWTYESPVKNHRRVRIRYTHQESAENKSQNRVLQNVGDEETRISFTSIELPITEAISQNPFGNSPACGNRIEYNPQTQEVKGTTKRKLVSRLIISKIYSEATVTNSWINTREDKLFTLNQSAFRSRDPETVMFVGMEVQQRSQTGDWRVSYTFEYMPTEIKDLSTLDIGDSSNKVIYPYRYYWAYYEEEEDTNQNVLVPKAKGFYEAEIYETSDFSTII